MTSHTARLRLNHSTRELFDLVADVESYPQFMPWVIAATISRRLDRTIWVAMTIGMGPLRKRFSTVGVLNPPSRIDVSSDDPLFERFKQTWTFEPTPEGGTRVTLTSELAVGGMLGALGHKAIVSKSKEITQKFAQALQAELRAAEAS